MRAYRPKYPWRQTMKKTTQKASIILSLLSLVFLSGCFKRAASEAPTVIIAETANVPSHPTPQKMWGICEVAINIADGTVTLVVAKGRGLTMYDAENKWVSQVTLHEKQYCRLSDGDHASIKYTIKSIKEDIVEVIVTDRFDARSFGQEITEKTKNIFVKPYKDSDINPASQSE